MALNLQSYLVVITLVLATVVFSFSDAYIQIPFGSWTHIDVNDPHVTEIAKFAISWRNAVSDTRLVFEKVIKAERRVAPTVTGLNYKLVLEAKIAAGDHASHYYEASLFDRDWENLRILSSFRKILAADALAPSLALGSWTLDEGK